MHRRACLAWGLERAGFDVTLLERSSQQRESGQNIDILDDAEDAIARRAEATSVRRWDAVLTTVTDLL
ncbi:MAG: hypothetical protein ABWX65_06485 [Mycetocola sp.]